MAERKKALVVKRKNIQDLTLINLRALKARVKALEVAIKALQRRLYG